MVRTREIKYVNTPSSEVGCNSRLTRFAATQSSSRDTFTSISCTESYLPTCIFRATTTYIRTYGLTRNYEALLLEGSGLKNSFSVALHQFLQTGRGPPVLVTELRSCFAVSREAEKWSLAIFFTFGPIGVFKG